MNAVLLTEGSSDRVLLPIIRQLSAFQRLVADTRAALAKLGLPLHPQDA